MRDNEFSPKPWRAGGWLQRLIFVVPVAAALSFTLCFFGPLDLFFNNHEELWFRLSDIMGRVAFTTALLFCVTVFIGMRIRRRKRFRVYVSLLFGLLLGNYIQGNFMNRDYGSLNGTAVNWSAYHSYGIVNTLIWLACLLLPLLLMRTLRAKRMRPVFIFVSCALIAMQATSLAVSRVTYPDEDEATATLTTDGMFELSKDQNTIVFVLDTLDEAYFRALVKKHPDIAQQFRGFTCYDNALASGARTPVALPLIMTGIPRTEAGAYSDYIESIWSRQTVFDDLKKAGFDIRLFTESRFVSKSAEKYVSNLDLSSSSVNDYGVLNGKLYRLTLYKYTPHFLKRFFWMSTNDFDQYQRKDEYVIDDALFYQNYQSAGRLTCTDQYKKSFRLYHLMGSHRRYTLSADGTRSRKTTSLMEQTEGVFHIVFELLDSMRENGVYDKANILIVADHGDKGKAQWAACLYKPAGATGEFKTNKGPVSFLDLPATLDSIAGGDVSKVGSGKTVTEGASAGKRTRTMYLNIGNNATFVTGEYHTDDHASVAKSLKLVNQYDVTDASTIKPYKLGKELFFTSEKATANAYCTHGFRTVNTNTTRMEGHWSQMVIPIKKPPKTGNLRFSMEYYSVKNESHMVVTVGGKTVFEQDMVKSRDHKTIDFDVPVSALEEDRLTVNFTFDDIPESEEEKDPGTRMQTVRATKLIITAEE